MQPLTKTPVLLPPQLLTLVNYKITLNVILLFIFFVACKKDVSPPSNIASNRNLPNDTSIHYLSDKIDFKFLRWIVDDEQHLLIATLNIPNPYSIQRILLVHGEGNQRFDIPKYNSTSSLNLYYKTDSGRIMVYASYVGDAPQRSRFQDEDDYSIGLYFFALDQVGISSVKVYFNPNTFENPPPDSTLSDELIFRPLEWVRENAHLISATFNIPENYLVADITTVTAVGGDTVTVFGFDSSATQKIYYIPLTTQFVIYQYTALPMPLPQNFDNPIAYVIALTYWKKDFLGYNTFIVKFK